MKEIANKEDLAQARATASQIRQGIHNYLATLALIAKANKERHWKVLGYDSWESYVDGEFGAERLRLPAEHRQKAIAELRLSGMSIRAIGNVLDIPKSSVADEVAQLSEAGQLEQPERVVSRDGRDRPASRPGTPSGDRKADARPVDDSHSDDEAPVDATSVGAGEAAVDVPGAPSTDAPGEEESQSPSVRAGAAPVSAPRGADTGVNPSPVEEFLANDPAVQSADYLAAFTSALSRAGGFMSFDAERVAQLAGTSTWDAIEAHASVVAHWYAKAQTARRGLRVIKGGVA